MGYTCKKCKKIGGSPNSFRRQDVRKITLISYKSAFVSDNGESVCLPKNNDRKVEHFKALTQVGHASAVADHAISTGHNIKWDHFEVLASGKCDFHCKIKETLFIRDLKPTLNDKVGSEKLWLY